MQLQVREGCSHLVLNVRCTKLPTREPTGGSEKKTPPNFTLLPDGHCPPAALVFPDL